MKLSRLAAATSFVAVAMLVSVESQGTILIDNTTRNGSFEVIDPTDAPLTNATRRASNTSTPFFIGSGDDEITLEVNGAFGGVDAPAFGAFDGVEAMLANTAVNLVTATFSTITDTFNIGDTFDVSYYTANNADGGQWAAGARLIFDLGLVTEQTFAVAESGVLTRNNPDFEYQEITGQLVLTEAFSTVTLVTRLENNVGGPVDQVYLDSVTLDWTPIPEPASLALVGLGGLALLARRRA